MMGPLVFGGEGGITLPVGLAPAGSPPRRDGAVSHRCAVLGSNPAWLLTHPGPINE